MSYVISTPSALAAVATDTAEIGSTLTAANAAAAAPTTSIAVAAADEVSTSVATLFGTFAKEYQALSSQAAEFHAWFVQTLARSAGLYALADSANASPLRSLAREALSTLNLPTGASRTGGTGTGSTGTGSNGAGGTGGTGTGTGTGGTGTGTGTGTGAGITATYAVTSQWSNGFAANYTVTNSGSTPLTNWQAQFTLPANESVTSAWNAQLAQSGALYTLTPESYNSTIAPGSSVTAGFQASQTGTYSPPTHLLVSGHAVGVGGTGSTGGTGTGGTGGTGSTGTTGGTGTGGTSGTGTGSTLITTQYGQTTIENSYLVQNNAYNNPNGQSIAVSSTGFTITAENGSAPTNGAPLGYPSIYLGTAYGASSPGTPLPEQLSQIQTATSSISYTYPSTGTYDASYDIWLNPTPITNGVNQQEVMIWFNHQGPIQPVGSAVGNSTIDGQSFTVWQGSNGSNNVVSYVATSPMSSWNNFNVLGFVNNTETMEPVTNSWYLTSIQAGFEPWNGSVGASVNSFSASVNGVS